MAHCSWISKSRRFLGLCYFDWFLLYWFTYSWGNSWLVFAGCFPRSANPDHFWRGIQGIHLGQLIQSGSQWVFVNKHWRSRHLSWANSCLHAQTGVLLFHIIHMSMAFLNCAICPNIHHAKVWASELEAQGLVCTLTRQSHTGSGWYHLVCSSYYANLPIRLLYSILCNTFTATATAAIIIEASRKRQCKWYVFQLLYETILAAFWLGREKGLSLFC